MQTCSLELARSYRIGPFLATTSIIIENHLYWYQIFLDESLTLLLGILIVNSASKLKSLGYRQISGSLNIFFFPNKIYHLT